MEEALNLSSDRLLDDDNVLNELPIGAQGSFLGLICGITPEFSQYMGKTTKIQSG